MAIQRDVGAVTSYAEAVAGGYTGTRAQWRQLLATLPNEPFIAEYNDTSFAEVTTALSGGKPVFLSGANTNADGLFPYVRTEPLLSLSAYIFAGYNGEKLWTFYLLSNDSWNFGSTDVAKVTSGIIDNATIDADDVNYDSTSSGLTADDVQDAIDEVLGKIPTKVSDLTNDSGFVTASTAPVKSVNGETGAVVLDASDIGCQVASGARDVQDALEDIDDILDGLEDLLEAL